MMNAETGFTVQPENMTEVMDSAGDTFAHKLGMRLAVLAGVIVILCGVGAGAAVVLVAGMPLQMGLVALAGSLLAAPIVTPLVYRLAFRLGNHTQRLSDLIETVSPSLVGAIDTEDFGSAGIPGINQIFAWFEWIDQRMEDFARGARTVEAERDQSRRMLTTESEAKTQFFAKMSHELRTPLNAILGYATLLHEDADERKDDAGKADLERIQLAGRRLLSLIDDLLELSGLRDGQTDQERTVFNLSDLMKELADRVENFGDRIAVVKIDECPDGQMIVGDRRKISRCLKNVMDSVIDLSSDGRIEIDVCTENSDVNVRVKAGWLQQEGQNLAEIFNAPSIKDSGISQSIHGSIGLSVARDLARSMGGECRIESVPGQGTALVLTFPADSNPTDILKMTNHFQSQTALNAAAGQTSGPHRTALIIDDDPAAIDLLSRWLSRWGYRIIHAENGLDGLAMARAEHPDLVLLDALMPGKTGYEVLHEMREDPDLADTPIVLVTVDDDKNRGIRAGASDYIRKPISESQLRDVVETYNANVSGDILIIDDDDDASTIMQRNLEKLGFTGRRATNGAEGLEMAREKIPSAIVLDLAMPQIDGFEFLQSIGCDLKLAQIPVIVVSGFNLSLPQHHILRKAGARYFRKGSSAPREIAETLRELVS